MDKKSRLMGLVYGCQLGYPLPDCPFNRYRKLPLIEWADMLETMSGDMIDELLEYHRACLDERENNSN